jgi:hypothetical protein
VAWQILGIPTSQIEMEQIFSIARILIALKNCQLQINHLNQMIFANKNWAINPRVGCF